MAHRWIRGAGWVAVLLAVALKGNLYVQTTVGTEAGAVNVGVPDDFLGNIGPAEDPIPPTPSEEAWTDAEVFTNLPDAAAERAYAESMAGRTLLINELLVTPRDEPTTEERRMVCQQQNAAA